MTSTWKIRISLALNFVVFAILLNTVGIVIKRVIDDYGVNEATASSLEGFKDLSIAFASFFLASYIPRLGYRRSMLMGLLAVTLASMLVATVAGFWITPVLYMTVGVSFALMKGSVYSTIGLVTRDQKEHTSLMNVLEGTFQVGALAGPLFFTFVLGLHHSWRETYWIVATVSALAFVLLLTTPLDETEVVTHKEQTGFAQMLKLLRLPMVWVFVLCAWLYVMIEQSLGTWMPTFNERIFGLSPAVAAGLLSLYAGSIALSRFLMGYLSRRLPWLPVQLSHARGRLRADPGSAARHRRPSRRCARGILAGDPAPRLRLSPPRLLHRADLSHDRLPGPEPSGKAAPLLHDGPHHRVLGPRWHHGIARRGFHLA